MTPEETTHARSLEDLFGPPISVYSREDAIRDGVLVDLSQFPVCREHYAGPVACTASVWDIIERAVANPKFANDYEGVLHNMLWMSRVARKPAGPELWFFQVRITGAGPKSVYSFKMVCDTIESGSVLTILLSDED